MRSLQVITVLSSSQPLLCHNIRLANPDDFHAKKISEITKKRSMTEEDRKAISDLEWEGSLYIENGQIGLPTSNIRKCLIETGKITREGKTIARGVSPLGQFSPLDFPELYNGNKKRSIEEIRNLAHMRDVTLVGVQKSRVVRTRPIFRSWKLRATWLIRTEVIDLEDFQILFNQAGIVEGLGDNRSNGFGRFSVEFETSNPKGEVK